MKRIAGIGILIVVSVVITTVLFAQQVENTGGNLRLGEFPIINTNAGESADRTVATELLQTLLVDDFEAAGEWTAFIPRDYGYASAIRREGSPAALKSDKNKYVLGVKVSFMKRDWSWLSITPAKPAKIRGITKNIKVWVVGRNYRHVLSVVLRDYLDRVKYLRGDRLIWVGWKQMTVNIPDTIEQENYKVSEERGITFIGFRVDFEPDDMIGRPFYIYFDYLTADVDLYSEMNLNADDMIDNW